MQDSGNQLIHLTAGAWEADVVPSFGANLVRLIYSGCDILRTPQDLDALASSPFLHGTPVLMPPNRTDGGRFTFAGRQFELPLNEPARGNHIHGVMYDAPYQVIHKNGRELVCSHTYPGTVYPFQFEMRISFFLDDDGLRQEIAISNQGDGPMPIVLALHTTFVKPADFSVPIGRRWETNERYIPTGRMLELTEQEALYTGSFRLTDQVISGFYTAAGHCAKVGEYWYEVADCFDQWVLFNGGGKQDFLCIEPQIGPVNSLNRPGSYPLLPAGDTFLAWTAIRRAR